MASEIRGRVSTLLRAVKSDYHHSRKTGHWAVLSLAVLTFGYFSLAANAQTNQWTWVGGSSTLGATGAQPGVYGTLGIPAATNSPGGRAYAVSWTDSKGNLWLFGGDGTDTTGEYRNLNDLWEFNPSTKEWVWMSGSNTVTNFWGTAGVYGTLGEPAAANVPGGRYGAVGWTDSKGNLWLFGGWGCESVVTNGFPDTCYFNVSAHVKVNKSEQWPLPGRQISIIAAGGFCF